MTRRGETAQQLSRAAPPLSWFSFHAILLFTGYAMIGGYRDGIPAS